jgi:hypothetical protein
MAFFLIPEITESKDKEQEQKQKQKQGTRTINRIYKMNWRKQDKNVPAGTKAL